MTAATLSARFAKHSLKQIATLGYREGDRVCLRAFPPDKGTGGGRKIEFTYPELPIEAIEELESNGYGIYLVVNPGGHSDADITECRAIFYEHDDLDIELSRALWQSLGLPEPTMQVETGGKSLHSYWTLLGAISPQLWRSLQADLLEFADADRKLKNPSRVLRLAGCRHAKTGKYALITGGCGKAYSFEELRGIIPTAQESQKQVEGVVTWTQFCKDFRFPILESIPLESCLPRKSRERILSGARKGSRNEDAYFVAIDLLAISAHLAAEGQRFDGDPYQIFIQFCQRCDSGDDWNQHEWDQVWKSAQRKPRHTHLSPEMIENCVRGWAWNNCPNRAQSVDVSGVLKSFPPPVTVQTEEISESQSDEEKLRTVISNYNRIQDAGNQFQLIPYRNWLRKEYGLSWVDIESLSKSLRQQGSEMVALPDAIQTIEAQIIERSQDTSVPGISCGFYDLDAMTQGFQRSDLIILAGRPSMGKSCLAMNIARNVALYHNLPVAVFALEMSNEQLAYRLVAEDSSIEVGRLRAGRIQQNEWGALGDAIARLCQAPVFLYDSPTVTTEEIRQKCRTLQAQQGLGMVVVDYLQLIGGGGENRVQELARITKDLKAIAREFNVPVIALSQLSRGVEQRSNKRPMMSDLRDSGGIEQDADLIAMLYRDEYYNPETPDRGIAELIICKHRNGPIGTVRLLFEPQFTRFKNLAPRLNQ